MISRRAVIGAALAGLPAIPEAQGGKFEPTDRYAARRILGWTALVNRGFERDREMLCLETLRLLEFQLYQVTRVLPSPALQKILRVRIWVELNESHHPCMAYHPDAGWLRDHDMNPDKAKCVEIANAENFLAWTHQQPWMVLHELAHAYHDQALGFDNAEVRTAYEAAKRSGRYASVLRFNGKTERHYALNDPKEYFAEATEAYFGTNDFFPFVRPELEKHDPEGFRVVRKRWGVL
jgi:hypothetical protein